LPKITINFTYIVYVIGVITIIYASFSTLRTLRTDIKELIAYSSVSHAAVYLIGVFSNTVQGIEGSIILGLAHGFVSSGLFICAGGILYDRFGTRIIHHYRGIVQRMPIFSILYFLLSLSNCGAPLSLNFIGEFMSLYGVFERLPILGILASSSIILSAAYTIYMYNRIAFGGSFNSMFLQQSWRKILVWRMCQKNNIIYISNIYYFLGIYPSLDGLHSSITNIKYYFLSILAS
jgi:NADH-ubiquinone oxidoreductase chain 4